MWPVRVTLFCWCGGSVVCIVVSWGETRMICEGQPLDQVSLPGKYHIISIIMRPPEETQRAPEVKIVRLNHWSPPSIP